MPRGNKRFLLAALALLWLGGVGYLLAFYAAMAAFDGREVLLVEAAALYGGAGFVVATVLYAGVGSLLDRGR